MQLTGFGGPPQSGGSAPGKPGRPGQHGHGHPTATRGAWPAASAGRGRAAGTPPGHAAPLLAPPQPSLTAPQGLGSSWGAVSTWLPCTGLLQLPASPGQP